MNSEDRKKFNEFPKIKAPKLKCDYCGGTWFESKLIVSCEFTLSPIMPHLCSKPVRCYYKCVECQKLTEHMDFLCK